MESQRRRSRVAGPVLALLLPVNVLLTATARGQEPLEAPLNLDFEEPPVAGGQMQGWLSGGEDYELIVDKSVAHRGAQSGRIRYAADASLDDRTFGTLAQGILPDEFRGHRVRLTGYLRTKAVEYGWAGLWMRVDAEEGAAPLAFDDMQDRPAFGTTDWKQYRVVLDVPTEAAVIYYGVQLVGDGTAWVDDLSIKKVDRATPTTDLRRRTAPMNMAFEAPTRGERLPRGWSGGGENYELTTDTKTAHRGDQSGRIRYVGAGPPAGGAFGTLTQGMSPDRFRGKRVRYSGYLRTDGVTGGWAGLWLRVDGHEPGKPLAFDNMSQRGVTGTTQWTRYEIVLDVPEEAQALAFGILLIGPGTVWADDLKLEPADNR